MSLVLAVLGALRAALKTRTDLTLENLALRQQLALLRRRSKRPQFGRLDRLLWVWLANQWAGWREVPPRSPRDRDSLASAGLPRFLDLEVSSRANGSTASRLGACESRTHHGARESAGARHAFTASCSNSGWTSRSAPLPGSCRVARSYPLRPGARSSRTISPTSSPSISSSFRPRPSGSSTYSWSAESSPPGRALQRDRLPFCRLDSTTNCRSLPR